MGTIFSAQGIGAILLVGTLMLSSGCATVGDTNLRLQAQVTGAGSSGAAGALRVLDAAPRKRADQVVYLLNKGMLLRYQGEYAASNEALEKAKNRIESLRALSLREQAGALAVSEGQRAYLGDPHEQTLVYLYKALNYLALDDPRAARVEMLQADLYLRDLAPAVRARAAEPALRYVAGLVFEHLDERDQAMVAYRLALSALDAAKSEVPVTLRRSLLLLSAELGLREEHARLSTRFGPGPEAGAPDTPGAELVLLVHAGLVPPKLEHAIHAVDPHTGRFHRIATPFYAPRTTGRFEVRVSMPGADMLAAGDTNSAGGLIDARTELLQDVEALSRRALDEQMGGIVARAVGRAVIKAQAIRQANDKDPALALLANVATAMTERADTRSWLTLPAQLYVARLRVPPGEHTVRVEVLGGNAGRRQLDLVLPPVADGARLFISPHLPGSTGS